MGYELQFSIESDAKEKILGLRYSARGKHCTWYLLRSVINLKIAAKYVVYSGVDNIVIQSTNGIILT